MRLGIVAPRKRRTIHGIGGRAGTPERGCAGGAVGHSHLTRRRSRRFLQGVGLLAVAVLFFSLLSAGGEEFIKKSFITPGDPKPIHLNADNVCTWTEGPLRVFLLRGTAWIEQGL